MGEKRGRRRRRGESWEWVQWTDSWSLLAAALLAGHGLHQTKPTGHNCPYCSFYCPVSVPLPLCQAVPLPNQTYRTQLPILFLLYCPVSVTVPLCQAGFWMLLLFFSPHDWLFLFPTKPSGQNAHTFSNHWSGSQGFCSLLISVPYPLPRLFMFLFLLLNKPTRHNCLYFLLSSTVG